MERTNPWIWVHSYALRFSLHLALISLFETIFFWRFVSESEDAALIGLVNNYTASTLGSCANLTVAQRLIVADIFALFINQTDAAGFSAATTRTAYNAVLFRNSWIYLSCILSVFGAIFIVGYRKGYKTEWSILVGENVALVTLLGLYEWMFFSTIILRYQAISIPELDRMVMDEFSVAC